jgi:uncharacterized protein with von Willebrand factor type A (vWA) domain
LIFNISTSSLGNYLDIPNCVVEHVQEKEKKSSTAMITFYPKFDTPTNATSEFIFLLDRSGSMSGTKINSAVNVLQLFVRSLPKTCKFNIIGFGDRFQKLFPTSLEYNEKNFQEAVYHIATIKADLGGK